MTDLAGTVLCPPTEDTCNGWEFNGDKWTSKNITPPAGTYYVEGDAKVNGNMGLQSSPAQISIIAEGSIEIDGKSIIVSNDPEVLFVTDGDLRIKGGGSIAPNHSGKIDKDAQLFVGQILVHEQLDMSGKPTVTGQFIVENAESLDGLVKDNEISNDVVINFSGELGSSGGFSVSGWRDVR